MAVRVASVCQALGMARVSMRERNVAASGYSRPTLVRSRSNASGWRWTAAMLALRRWSVIPTRASASRAIS